MNVTAKAYNLLRVARVITELRVDNVARTPPIQDPGRSYVACIALAFAWRRRKSWIEAMRIVGGCLGLNWRKIRKSALTLGMLVRPRSLLG